MVRKLKLRGKITARKGIIIGRTLFRVRMGNSKARFVKGDKFFQTKKKAKIFLKSKRR